MDYIAQYYKNRTIQLQEELEQLTETYNYRLNEAGGWFGGIGRLFGIADDAVPILLFVQEHLLLLVPLKQHLY